MRTVASRLMMDMAMATAPSPACGINATRETKKQLDRLMNAEPAWARPAADAPSPKMVCDRSDTATNRRPIRIPAEAAAAVKYPVNSAGTTGCLRRHGSREPGVRRSDDLRPTYARGRKLAMTSGWLRLVLDRTEQRRQGG